MTYSIATVLRFAVVASIYLIACCCPRLYGLGIDAQISQYGHTAWQIGERGLESGPIAIAQTTDGYIWLGTFDGLLRFDGIHFTRWSSPFGESLPSQNIVHLLGAREGSLYIGTEDGLARLTHDHLFRYSENLRFPGPFLEDERGHIWMGQKGDNLQSRMLCRIEDKHLTCVGTKDGFVCQRGTAVLSDKPDSLWVGSDEGICHWQPNSNPESYRLAGLTDDRGSVGFIMALAKDQAGSLWAGSRRIGSGRGLLKFSHGNWKTYVTPWIDGSQLPVSFLFTDRSGSMWIGTDSKGLYRLNGRNLDHFDTADGLTSSGVRQIFEDREGNLWVATDKGLDVFHDLSIISFTGRQGLSDDTAKAVSIAPDGSVWIGTDHVLNILHDLHDLHFSYIKPGHGLPADDVDLIFRDSRNQMWLSGGQSLFQYVNGNFKAVEGQGDQRIHYVVDIAEDSRHELWISDLNLKTRQKSLLHLRGSRIVEKFSTPGGQSLFLAPDLQGGLWAGGYLHGLYLFRDGKFEPMKPEGFDGNVFRLNAEPDGSLWIQTVQHLLFLFRDGRARNLSSKNGLPCDSNYAVASDHAGSHWFYMQCGVVRIRDSEIQRWWNQPASSIQTTVFDVRDGSRAGWTGPDLALSSDGRLWSVNEASVQMIDSKHLPFNSLPPPVLIERLIVDHQEFRKPDSLNLQMLPREIEIDYTGLSYVVPEKVRFRYRLVGRSSEWTDSGTRRQAFYTDLGPGHYTFQVLACNNNNVWNLRGAAVSFTIPPAWYQTLWFRLFCLLSTLGLFYLLYVLRLRQSSAAMKLRFDERLEERTRLARELHDTLLQTIQGSKMVVDHAQENVLEPVAKESLSRVAEWLERASLEGRSALESLRNSISEHNDLAAAFRRTFEESNLDQGGKFALTVKGEPQEMHPIARDELYRIGDEAIRNACLHSGASQVAVELVYDPTYFWLSVRDDGCGIDSSTLNIGKAGRYGLIGMKERAGRIAASLTVSSSHQGTAITLGIPGETIYNASHVGLRKAWYLLRRLKNRFRSR